MGAYMAGVDKIRIRFRPEKYREFRKEIRRFLRNTRGFEVMDESENYVELICLINASEMPLSASINRMYLQLASLVRDIVSVLEGDDLDHYIVTREERIKGPITKFVPVISDSIKKFRNLINPMRSLIKKNGFISGSNPGIEDSIFFGNFKWVYTCSSCNLLDKEDEIFQWYKKINQIFNIETH